MVATILEAHVEPTSWHAMLAAYQDATKQLPSQMVQTFLLQSSSDKPLWRVISIWKSREALEAYRRSVETPGGVLLFRSVGAEPSLAVFDVAVQAIAASPDKS